MHTVLLSCDAARSSDPLESGAARAVLSAAQRVVGAHDAARDVLIAASEDDRIIETFPPPYDEAANALVSPPPIKLFGAPIIADALARAHDERAENALMRWADGASRHRSAALLEMTKNPSPRYLATARQLLAEPERAGELISAPRLHGYERLFAERPTMVSVHGAALSLAAAIADAPARELLRTVAADASLPSPDPRTLDALRCTKRPGWEGAKTRDEAAALASPRFLALALLGDDVLTRAVAVDPAAPALLRDFARRMSSLPPMPPMPNVDPVHPMNAAAQALVDALEAGAPIVQGDETPGPSTCR